jgi:hypothetical protein
MELDHRQDSNTNDNSDIDLFTLRGPALHTQECGEAPECSGSQKQKEKRMPRLPRPVRQQNDKQGDIGNRGN